MTLREYERLSRGYAIRCEHELKGQRLIATILVNQNRPKGRGAIKPQQLMPLPYLDTALKKAQQEQEEKDRIEGERLKEFHRKWQLQSEK